ncbi:hypothetical protein LCGC14_2508510 [marine sediment metagenome]|uniref:Uncharacterized protein n=1 Tax=marine sediment metagenome TaxID=412755 RepID=A0A0F9DBM6_9ZZZZ
MPKAQSQKRGGGLRKIGRAARKPKNAKYLAHHQREKNKIKRILQSNGIQAAEDYATVHNLHGFLRKLH